jgi:hypothetical protein
VVSALREYFGSWDGVGAVITAWNGTSSMEVVREGRIRSQGLLAELGIGSPATPRPN